MHHNDTEIICQKFLNVKKHENLSNGLKGTTRIIAQKLKTKNLATCIYIYISPYKPSLSEQIIIYL